MTQPTSLQYVEVGDQTVESSTHAPLSLIAWYGSEPHLGCQSWNISALYDLVLKHQLSALLLLCVKSGFSSRQNLISHSEHIRSSLVWWLGFKCWFNADTASLNRSPCSYPMLWSHGQPNDGLGCYRSVWSLHKARLSPGNVQPACLHCVAPRDEWHLCPDVFSCCPDPVALSVTLRKCLTSVALCGKFVPFSSSVLSHLPCSVQTFSFRTLLQSKPPHLFSWCVKIFVCKIDSVKI